MSTISARGRQLVAETGTALVAARGEGVIAETVATGTSVAPTLGHITIAGYAPTLSQSAHQTLSPAAGHAILAGYAPTWSQTGSQALDPAAGAIALVGYAPSLTQSGGLALDPAPGHAVLTGYAPGLSQSANQVLAPSKGAIVVAGKTPSLTASGVFVTPEPIVNNTGTPWVSQAVHWTRVINGRIGDMGTATIADGTGTTDSSGNLTLSGLAAGSGYLLVAKWNTGAADDDVYYIPCTVT